MDIEKLNPAVKAKLKGCETPEEIRTLAQEEGYELSDSELEGISGGWGQEQWASLRSVRQSQLGRVTSGRER